MSIDKYLSPLFGSKEWYEAIQDTYNFKNPFEVQGVFGVQTPLNKVYSFLPFSDWYFEVNNSEGLTQLAKELAELPCNNRFEARVLVKSNRDSLVSTYRMERLDPELRLKSMSKTTRRYTKKSLRNELILELGDVSTIDRFFKLHALTRKKLGLPVQPKTFFENIMKYMPDSQLAFCVTKEGMDAAAFFLLKKGKVLYYKYGASNPKLLGERPNHYLFYRLHDIAKTENLDTIDLGRTDEAGLHQFKAGLGATPMAIETIGPSGRLNVLQEGKGVLKAREIISHLPVSFHILAGKFFYRYLA